MKSILAITMAAVFASLSLSGASPAQPPNPPTPTTHILAIGPLTPESILPPCDQSCRTKSAKR
jgi:hypothetical protein